MVSILSPEGRQAVLSNSLYPEAKEAGDPLSLWVIITATHVTCPTTMAGGRQFGLREAQKKLAALRMVKGQTLYEYREVFEQAVRTVQGLGGATESEESLAVAFMDGASSFYGEYIRLLQNNLTVNKSAKIPTTVQAVFQQMLKYKVAEDQVSMDNRKGSSYKTQMHVHSEEPRNSQHGRDRASDTCQRCGGVGHWSTDCPSIKGVTKTPKDNHGASSSSADAAKHAASTQQRPKGSGRGGGRGGDGRGGRGAGRGSNPGRARSAGGADHHYVSDPMIDLAADGDEMFHTFNIGPRGGDIMSHASWPNRRDWFIYDSGATGHLVNSSKLLTHVRTLTDPVFFTGVTGTGECTVTGELPLIGSALMHPQAPLNCISGPQVEEYFPVVFEQHQHYKIRITNELDFVFNYDPRARLYVSDLATIIAPMRYMAPPGFLLRPVHAVSVREMESRYTKKEVSRANIASDMLEKLGHCAPQDLIRMLRAGSIVGVPITVADVERSLSIHGRPVATIKGKSTYKQASSGPIMEKVPRSSIEIEMHCDAFYVDGVNMLLTVCKPTGLLMVRQLATLREEDIVSALSDHVKLLREQGCTPTEIHLDPASAHVAIGRSTFGVPIRLVAPGTHVVVAERAIRVVKERMRCVICTLPYPLPRALIPWLAAYAVNRINCIPNLRDTEVSAREHHKHIKLNFKVDFCLSFGDYVHVYNSTAQSSRNATLSRTSGCIALMSADNGQKAWRFYKLDTGKIVTSTNYTVLPTPQEVIRHLDNLWKSERGRGLTSGDPNRLSTDEVVQRPPEMPTVGDEIIPPEPVAVIEDGDALPPTDPPDEPPAEPPEPPTPIPIPTSNDTTNDQSDTHMHISMNRGLRLWGDVANEALASEVRQLHEKGTFEPVLRGSLSAAERRTAIHCSLFFKEKRDQDGALVKLKARLVAGGNEQDTSLIGDVSSPTVLVESLFCVLAIAAIEHRSVMSVDIEGAYLECDMEGPAVYMVLQPPLAKSLVEIDSTLSRYKETNGSMVVRLRKALYGCVQSGKLWYNKLTKCLLDMGYTANPVEPCIFNRTVDRTQMTVAIYVDDLLITHKSHARVKSELNNIGVHFAGFKVQDGSEIGHLGMRITAAATGDIEVDMTKYTLDAVAAWNPKRAYATPGDRDLFSDGGEDLLDQTSSMAFHSAAARLLFLAKRTRPDILVEVSAMCSRVSVCTRVDWAKMDRIFGYLKGTPRIGIRFVSGGNVCPVVYSDASHGCHLDGTSRTGIIVMLAGGPVAVASSKQKLVTKSSAEAELVGICDGATTAIQVRSFLTHQGHRLEPTPLMEDNESTIKMVQAGKPTTRQSRHINMRFYFVKQHVVSGEVVVVYCCTADMLADMCTKGLTGSTFVSIRDRVLHPL